MNDCGCGVICKTMLLSLCVMSNVVIVDGKLKIKAFFGKEIDVINHAKFCRKISGQYTSVYFSFLSLMINSYFSHFMAHFLSLCVCGFSSLLE